MLARPSADVFDDPFRRGSVSGSRPSQLKSLTVQVSQTPDVMKPFGEGLNMLTSDKPPTSMQGRTLERVPPNNEIGIDLCGEAWQCSLNLQAAQLAK